MWLRLCSAGLDYSGQDARDFAAAFYRPTDENHEAEVMYLVFRIRTLEAKGSLSHLATWPTEEFSSTALSLYNVRTI